MKQYALPFLTPEYNATNHDFITSLCNIEAYKAINNYTNWPSGRILILGEEGSGKTHLSKIWLQNTNAYKFESFFQNNLYNLKSNFLLAEDIDSNYSELDLFHIINYCSTENVSILLTARQLPNFNLNDLRSRINATHKILIKQPDEELMAILLNKYFIAQQIDVEPETIEYISSRIERSFYTVKQTAFKLDHASFKYKKAITIPFVKHILSI